MAGVRRPGADAVDAPLRSLRYPGRTQPPACAITTRPARSRRDLARAPDTAAIATRPAGWTSAAPAPAARTAVARPSASTRSRARTSAAARPTTATRRWIGESSSGGQTIVKSPCPGNTQHRDPTATSTTERDPRDALPSGRGPGAARSGRGEVHDRHAHGHDANHHHGDREGDPVATATGDTLSELQLFVGGFEGRRHRS